MKHKQVKDMMIFRNGNIAAFDESGNQIPDLQMYSAIGLWCKFAESLGYRVEGCNVALTDLRGKIENGNIVLE